MTLTSTYDVEYDGVLIADGDRRSVISAKIFENPEIRSSDQVRGQLDGLFPGQDLYGGRTIELEIEVWGETEEDFYQSYYEVLGAVRKRVDEKLLKVRLPQWPDLQVACRPRRVSGPVVEVQFDLWVSRVVVQFFSTDPRLYAAAESTGTAQVTSFSNGLQFDLTFDMTFGGIGTSNMILARNDGTYETPWRATINGPIVNPQIESVEQGKIIKFSGTVNDGESLIVVSRPSSLVLLNGTASRYSWIEDSDQWFMLQPGDNQIRFSGSSSGSPTLVLQWRSAWV